MQFGPLQPNGGQQLISNEEHRGKELKDSAGLFDWVLLVVCAHWAQCARKERVVSRCMEATELRVHAGGRDRDSSARDWTPTGTEDKCEGH
jgi:hypothetical protein